MPESVQDRPTRSHEYIYLLAKSERYFYDNIAIQEETVSPVRLREKNNGESAVDTKMRGHDSHCGTYENGRNKRSVWHINTNGNSAAHFAQFPLELPTLCIKAGTSERGCCGNCGKQYERVTEKDNPPHDGITKSAYAKGTTANRMSILRQAARERGEEYVNRTITTGWTPTCACVDAGVIPATVADFFNGSGTSGRAAMKLGRSYIGIDISESYITDLCEDDNRAANGLNKRLIGGDVDLANMPMSLWAEVTK